MRSIREYLEAAGVMTGRAMAAPPSDVAPPQYDGDRDDEESINWKRVAYEWAAADPAGARRLTDLLASRMQPPQSMRPYITTAGGFSFGGDGIGMKNGRMRIHLSWPVDVAKFEEVGGEAVGVLANSHVWYRLPEFTSKGEKVPPQSMWMDREDRDEFLAAFLKDAYRDRAVVDAVSWTQRNPRVLDDLKANVAREVEELAYQQTKKRLHLTPGQVDVRLTKHTPDEQRLSAYDHTIPQHEAGFRDAGPYRFMFKTHPDEDKFKGQYEVVANLVFDYTIRDAT